MKPSAIKLFLLFLLKIPMKFWSCLALAVSGFGFFPVFFKLRLLVWRKLRLSAWGFCVLGWFFGLGLEGDFAMRLWDGRVATLHDGSLLKLLSDTGGCFAGCGFLVGRWQRSFQNWALNPRALGVSSRFCGGFVSSSHISGYC